MPKTRRKPESARHCQNKAPPLASGASFRPARMDTRGKPPAPGHKKTAQDARAACVSGFCYWPATAAAGKVTTFAGASGFTLKYRSAAAGLATLS